MAWTRIRGGRLIVGLLGVLFLSACGDDTAVCPDGSVELGGRCLDPDAGLDGGAEPDADLDGGAVDATVDGSVAEGCAPEDVEAWRAIHEATDLNASFADCSNDPECTGESCSFADCVWEGAGLGSCASCVRSEAGCVASSCATECGPSASSARCRWCLCREGCVEVFDACAGAELDVCGECDDAAQLCGPVDIVPVLPFEGPDAIFERASEGTYLTGPPNAEGGFMAVAAVDEIRREDWRKPLTVGLYLIEGEAMQLLADPTDLGAESWNLTGDAVATGEYHRAPADGPDERSAVELSFSEDTRLRHFDSSFLEPLAEDTHYTFSVWVKLVSGNPDFRVEATVKTGRVVAGETLAATETWQRVGVTFDTGTGDTPVIPALRNIGGPTVLALWGANLTAGRYPTSTILSQSTRAAERLRIAGDIGAEFADGPWRMTYMPQHAHDESGTGILFVLRASENGASIRHQNPDRKVSTAVGPSSEGTRWSRYDTLSVVVQPLDGELELLGFDGGNGLFRGDPWTFDASASVDVGQREAVGHIDGLIEPPLPVE